MHVTRSALGVVAPGAVLLILLTVALIVALAGAPAAGDLGSWRWIARPG